MHSPFRAALRLALWAAVVLAAGCGASRVKVAGTIDRGGKPLQVGKQGMVRVIFHPLLDGESGTKTTYPGLVKEDGTFEVLGQGGKGIPPGKYRVEVHQWDPYPKVDKLQGKFGPASSPIEVNVTGQNEIHLDLDRPGGG